MENWSKLATDSLRAAELCLGKGHWRSATSRAYFATYSAATAALKREPGLRPPESRDAWSHARTIDLVREWVGRTLSLHAVNELGRRLRLNYNKRLDADYHLDRIVDERVARRCIADAEAVMNMLGMRVNDG